MSAVFIVRQHPPVFVVFVLVGALFIVFPWAVNASNGGFSSIVGKVVFSFLGLACLCVGLLGWKTTRIGLVADCRGIWCNPLFVKKALIPWDEIRGIRKVTWNSPEGEHNGVLIGLNENFPAPGGRDFEHAELERMIGDVEFSNPLLLGHDEWDWKPEEFVALALRYIHDADARKELGQYRTERDVLDESG